MGFEPAGYCGADHDTGQEPEGVGDGGNQEGDGHCTVTFRFTFTT